MMLDATGKAIRRNRLITPDWLKREAAQLFHDREADRRVLALRDSILQVDPIECGVGATICVQLPGRYAKPETDA